VMLNFTPKSGVCCCRQQMTARAAVSSLGEESFM
jgi:hypothetical protein